VRVVLCSPPSASSSARRAESLGIRYLASYAKGYGHDVIVVDAHCWGMSVDQAIDAVASTKPDILGLQLLFHQQLLPARSIASAYCESFPGAKIIAGGHVATFLPNEFMNRFPEVAAIALGEGEEAFVKLLGLSVWDDRSLCDVPGIAFRCANEVFHTRPATLLPSLDKLAFPVRDARDYEREKHASIVASRGCCYSCEFCSVPGFSKVSIGPRWRLRSIKNVVQEMDDLHSEYGVTHFSFLDDIFLSTDKKSQRRAYEFAESVSASLPWAHFSIECRADAINKHLFALLRTAGLELVFVGLESGDELTLSRFNKHITLSQNRAAIDILCELDLPIAYGFIMFSPESSLESVEQSVEFLKELGIATAHALASKLGAYPGTAAHSRLLKEGRLVGDVLAPSYQFTDPQTAAAFAAFQSLFRPLVEFDTHLKRLEFGVSLLSASERPAAFVRYRGVQNRYSGELCHHAKNILRGVKQGTIMNAQRNSAMLRERLSAILSSAAIDAVATVSS
jgi:anaerobic magnesium-protoporphyrin IX monomethyl ester cyclase